jgi:hypothetical protein
MLVSRMPPERRAAIANLIRDSKPKFDQLIEKATAIPGVNAAVKPALDTLRARFDTLTRV